MHLHPHRRRPGLFLVASAFALVVAACGGSTPPASSAGPASGSGSTAASANDVPGGFSQIYENVTVADNATVVDAATVAREFHGGDADGTLRFGPGASELKDLKPGVALAVEGVALRKVVSVSESGGEIVVRTEDATLADFVKSGHLGWDYAVDWNSLPAATYKTAAAGAGLDTHRIASATDVAPPDRGTFDVAGTEMKFSGKVKGFDIELKLVPGATQLGFEMSATRSNVKATAKGFLTTFRHEADFDVEDGDPELFQADVTGLKGEAELTWAAFQVSDPSLDEDITALEVPLSIPIPFSVGPVPMTLSVKMNMRFVPSMSAGQASSGGSFKVTYDSEQGFSTNGKDVTPLGKAVNFVADLGSTDTVTAGLGPVGFGFGVEWPRMELAIGNPLMASLMKTYAFVTMNTYLNGMWTPGTTLTAHIPPCQRASIKLSAIAGYKLNVLGFAELSDNKLIWEKKLDRFKDDKPCTLTGEAP